MTGRTSTAAGSIDFSRPSLATLVRVELRKSTDTRAGRWLLGLMAVASVAGIILLLIFGQATDRDFSGFLYTSQLPMAVLLPVLGILSMTGEWSQRTALQTFALVPDRSRVLRSKLLGLISLVLILVAAALVAAVVATLIARFGNGGDWGPVAGVLGRVVLFDVLVVLTGAAFGLLLLNAPAAIVGFFVLPSLLTALVSFIAALAGPVRWVDFTSSVTQLLGDDLGGRAWARIAVSVAVWAVLPLVGGAVRVQRRDVQ